MRTLVGGVLLAALGGCVACRAPALSASGPLTAAPRAGLVTPSGTSPPNDGVMCGTDVDRLSSGGTVAADPIGVDAGWYPGMDSRPCIGVLTHGTAEQARRLAFDIRHLPTLAQGEYNCPGADNGAVQLVFSYPRHRYEQVLVLFSGCAGVAGGGQMTSALKADLRPLAPPAWRRYLGN